MSNARVVLHQFVPLWGLPDLSPFCLKVETYLRMAEVPFTTCVGDPRKAPKQKLPVLEDGGRRIADSGAIIAHLEATRGAPLDADLSPAEAALARLVRSTLEEHLYFVVVYQRWKIDANWEVYKEAFFRFGAELGVPSWVRGIVVKQVRKSMLTALFAQGTGRHDEADNTATGLCLLDSLETLCVGPYFLGARPRVIDATVYGFLAGIWASPIDDTLSRHARQLPKLSAYLSHMVARHFH